MQIYVNGSPTQVTDPCTLADLIAALDLAGRRLAVEVNEELVPRSRFAERALVPADRVEIIHAVGGG
jgi:sulfur carrier protein